MEMLYVLATLIILLSIVVGAVAATGNLVENKKVVLWIAAAILFVLGIATLLDSFPKARPHRRELTELLLTNRFLTMTCGSDEVPLACTVVTEAVDRYSEKESEELVAKLKNGQVDAKLVGALESAMLKSHPDCGIRIALPAPRRRG